MTSEELKAIGEKLYGPRWKSAMARAIGRHKVTVWRWAHGKDVVPVVAANRIRQLAEQGDKP